MEENQFSIKDLLNKAQEAKKIKDNDGAINWYLQIIQQDALNITAYNKLVKLYRKKKDYRKELAAIKKAIKFYEAYYRSLEPKHTKSINQLSEKLNKAFGLVDKKGVKAYYPELIGSWQKRKKIVESKLK